MISNETMQKIIDNSFKIKELAQVAGFKNIRLLTPALPGQKDDLHLLVDRVPNTRTDMCDKIELANRIKAIIDCPVNVVTEQQIPKILKKEMLENPIPIGNTQEIKKLFQKKLIPFSQTGDFEESFQTEQDFSHPLAQPTYPVFERASPLSNKINADSVQVISEELCLKLSNLEENQKIECLLLVASKLNINMHIKPQNEEGVTNKV